MDALVVAVSGIVESLTARRRFGAGDWTVRCGPAVNEPRLMAGQLRPWDRLFRGIIRTGIRSLALYSRHTTPRFRTHFYVEVVRNP